MLERQKRLNEVYEHLRKFHGVHTQGDFAERLGYSRSVISSALNGNEKYLTDSLFESINKAYRDVFSLDYLLNGKGTLLDVGEELFLQERENEDKLMELGRKSFTKGKPYYNVDFRCGFDILMNCQTQNPDYLIDFQPYNDCDLYCNAHGDSMHPTISSGDIVALKRIEDFRYLINGEIYAIVTSNGMRTIKRIRDNGDTFTLIADNQSISDQTIPKSLVTHAFLVRGSIKMF